MSARICPYVGLAEDPETSLAFPSELNCCHWADPIEPVNIDHQQMFCLSTRFSGCPMLVTKNHRTLSPELRLGGQARVFTGRRILPFVVILTVIFSIYLVVNNLGNSSATDNQGNQFLGPGSPTQILPQPFLCSHPRMRLIRLLL